MIEDSSPVSPTTPLLPAVENGDYGALAALLQDYVKEECWCGSCFADVVEHFIACPPTLDDPEDQPHEDDLVRFRDLYAMAPLSATERRDRLVADIMALLERYPQEDQRREQVRLRDDNGLLGFEEFWTKESWSLDVERAAGNFLTITVAYARAWDPHAWDEVVENPIEGNTAEDAEARYQRNTAILRARNKRAKEAFEALRKL